MHFLCTFEQLQNTPIQTFDLMVENEQFPVILLLSEDKIRAYHNQCPHAWVPLNRADSNILSGCQQYLQCSSHFAQFNMLDGYCVYGPCQGRSLRRLGAQLVDSNIFIYL